MSSRRLPLYDFLVDGVPGVISLLIFFSILPASYDVLGVLNRIGLFQGLIFLIISYVIGQLLQAVASPIDEKIIKHEPRYAKKAGLPYPFEDRLNEGSDSDDFSVSTEVKNHLEERFSSQLSGYELFSATQSYLWHGDIGRMRRFQRLYTLFRSLYVLFGIGAILHLFVLIGVYFNLYASTWSPVELGVITILLLLISVLSYRRRVMYHKEMARSMIVDIYANVVTESSGDDGGGTEGEDDAE